MHTWSTFFAINLLTEAGYKTVSKGKDTFVIEASSYNINPQIIRAPGGRVASADIREFLDHPISLGGMRVRQAPRSLVDFE